MKRFYILLFAFALMACEPSAPTKTTPTPITPKTSANEQVNLRNKKIALFDQLAENTPSWKPMPPQYWLPTQYIEDYNADKPTEDKISYEDDTAIFGEFNGDQYEDAVSLLINGKSEIWLMAFFGKKEGYDLEPIFPKEEGVFQRCCLGIGLKTMPPGAYTDVETGETYQVKNNGIEYTVYEKVSFLIFLENDKFRTIRLGD